MATPPTKEKTYLFDNPRNVRILLGVFFTVVALLLLLDFVVEKHARFEAETYFGFYGVFGFVACVVLVLVAKYILRPLVKRKEDYYD